MDRQLQKKADKDLIERKHVSIHDSRLKVPKTSPPAGVSPIKFDEEGL